MINHADPDCAGIWESKHQFETWTLQCSRCGKCAYRGDHPKARAENEIGELLLSLTAEGKRAMWV
jgi:hypothetical protein